MRISSRRWDCRTTSASLDSPEITGNFAQLGGTQFQYSVTATTYNADENLTKTLGRHQLLFGGRYRFEHIGSIPDEIKDAFQFGDYATALLNASTYTASAATATANTGTGERRHVPGRSLLLQQQHRTSVPALPRHGVGRLHPGQLPCPPQPDVSTLAFAMRRIQPCTRENGAMMGFDLKNDAIVTSGPTSQLIAEGLTTQAIITNDMNEWREVRNPVSGRTAAHAGEQLRLYVWSTRWSRLAALRPRQIGNGVARRPGQVYLSGPDSRGSPLSQPQQPLHRRL